MDELKNSYFYKKASVFLIVFALGYIPFLIFSARLKSMGAAYPFGDFLFLPMDKYTDFDSVNMFIRDLDPYRTGLSNYPPLILIFAYLFTLTGIYDNANPYEINSFQTTALLPEVFNQMLGFFIVCIVILLGAFLYTNFIAIKNRGWKLALTSILTTLGCAACVFSAPSRFLFDRGNYLVVSVLLLVLWALFEKYFPDKYYGAVFIGLCAAVKVYPIYIIGLYLFYKEFKKIGVSVFTGFITTIIPMIIFHGSLIENTKAFIKGMIGFGGGYLTYFNVGLTGGLSYLYLSNYQFPNGRVIRIIWFAFGLISTLVCFFLFKKDKNKSRVMFVVTALMIFLTPNSFLYNSTYLIAPLMIMLLNREKPYKTDYVYIVLGALLLVPKAYKWLPYFQDVDKVPGGILVNTAVIIDSSLYLFIILFYIVSRIFQIKRKNKVDN